MVHSASVPLCGGHSTCVTVVVCSPLLHFLLSSPPYPKLELAGLGDSSSQ